MYILYNIYIYIPKDGIQADSFRVTCPTEKPWISISVNTGSLEQSSLGPRASAKTTQHEKGHPLSS